MRLRPAQKEAAVWTVLLVVLLVVQIFLGVTGSDGIEDTKHRR